LDEESQRLAAIVMSSDDAMVSKTLDGRITSWNAGATRIFGFEAHEMVGQSITKIIPPDLHDEEKDILARLARGERIDHYETTRVAKDGRRVSISLTVSPIRDKLGRIVGASKVGRDITEKKQAEELQRLLVNELNHRIKNTLATVQAIATQTLRRAPSPGSFVSGFSGRIQALSKAHSLLTSARLHGAELSQLMREQLLLGGAEDSRISLSGPPVVLGAQTSVHLALVLHELGTNARKHGALSAPAGKVSVDWELSMGEGRMLIIDWRERGGPSVETPMKEGFGTTLIDQSLKAHGGEVSMRYGKAGLTCSIVLPLSETIQTVGLPTTSTKHKAQPAPSLVGQSKLPLSGRRILIVEDEAIVAMSLADDIADMGGEAVGPASTPEEAMQAIEEGGFDIALLDANLSGRPVAEVASALTQRGIPFVFISGYGRQGLPAAFQAAVIVEKPFTPSQVLAAIQGLLDPGSNVVGLKQKSASST
jgi:PAS domain S-box-containing protein